MGEGLRTFSTPLFPCPHPLGASKSSPFFGAHLDLNTSQTPFDVQTQPKAKFADSPIERTGTTLDMFSINHFQSGGPRRGASTADYRINHNVAAMLKKLLVEQTKSRPRRSNDNGLVEAKNGAVIRKHMGYVHIAPKATRAQMFEKDSL